MVYNVAEGRCAHDVQSIPPARRGSPRLRPGLGRVRQEARARRLRPDQRQDRDHGRGPPRGPGPGRPRRPRRGRRDGRRDPGLCRPGDPGRRLGGRFGHPRPHRLASAFDRNRPGQAFARPDQGPQLGRDRSHGGRGGPQGQAGRADHRAGLAPGEVGLAARTERGRSAASRRLEQGFARQSRRADPRQRPFLPGQCQGHGAGQGHLGDAESGGRPGHQGRQGPPDRSFPGDGPRTGAPGLEPVGRLTPPRTGSRSSARSSSWPTRNALRRG